MRKKFRPSASTEPEAPERNRLGDRLAELAGDLVALLDDAVAAVAEIGDQHRGPPLAARLR